MTDPVKASTSTLGGKNMLIWIVAVVVIILALGVALFMTWKKSGTTEARVTTASDTLDKARLEITQLQGEVKQRDEKINTLTERLGTQDKQITELQYQMREIRKAMAGRKATSSPAAGGKKQQKCDDESCAFDADIEDISNM